MKTSFVLALLFGSQVWALGPLRNGTYEGTTVCKSSNGPGFSSAGRLVVGDLTLESVSPQGTHLKRFVMVNSTEFRVNPDRENGDGYFTADGVFYRLTINGVQGADLYSYKNGVVEMTGSAVSNGVTYHCQGRYARI